MIPMEQSRAKSLALAVATLHGLGLGLTDGQGDLGRHRIRHPPEYEECKCALSEYRCQR